MPRQPGCCCGGRNFPCSAGEIAGPASFNVTFSGWTGGALGCGTWCDGINGTWVLDHCTVAAPCSNCGGSNTNECCWMARHTFFACGLQQWLDLSICLVDGPLGGSKVWELIAYPHPLASPCANATGHRWHSGAISGPPWSGHNIVLVNTDPNYGFGAPCSGPIPIIS